LFRPLALRITSSSLPFFIALPITLESAELLPLDCLALAFVTTSSAAASLTGFEIGVAGPVPSKAASSALTFFILLSKNDVSLLVIVPVDGSNSPLNLLYKSSCSCF